MCHRLCSHRKLAPGDSRRGQGHLQAPCGLGGAASPTCPQADDDSQVFGVFLHDDGSQDLAAQQGGLETVGERVEAPVAQHGYLVVEGAAGERELRGQEAESGPRSRAAAATPQSGRGERAPSMVNRPVPSQTWCPLPRSRRLILKPRNNAHTSNGKLTPPGTGLAGPPRKIAQK